MTSLASLLAGQTEVDLRMQSKNVDFSGASSTKPSQTGNVVPGTCSAGQTFFQLNATAGQNLLLCTSTNAWTALIGSGGGGGQPLSFATMATSTMVSIVNGSNAVYGCNGVNTLVGFGTTTLTPATGTSTEVLLIGIDCSDSHLTLIAPTNTVTCTPAGFSTCDAVTGSSFTDGIIPLASVVMTTDGAGSFTFGSVTDLRGVFQDDPLTPGAGILYTKAGSMRTLAVDSTAVPLLGTVNTYFNQSTPGTNPASGFQKIYAKAGSGFFALDSTGTERCTGSGGGSSTTTTETIDMPAGGCTASQTFTPLWWQDWSTTPAAGGCFGGTGIPLGALNFNAVNARAMFSWRIPQGWSGAVRLTLEQQTWFGSGTLSYNVETACPTAGADLDAITFNAAQSLSLTMAFGMQQLSTNSLTMTGCSPGQTQYVRVTRTDSNGNANYILRATFLVPRSL
jgi:hypothetical protein